MLTEQTRDWVSTFAEIEDKLAPQLELDTWERTLYYYLLRHTRLINKKDGLFSIPLLTRSLPLSDKS